MPPIRALPMLAMSPLVDSASPKGSQSPGKPYSTSPPKKGHTRARSSSGSSSTSTGSGGSRTIPSFPILLATQDTVLEQNAADILWKTFVAFEQDCRDTTALLPLLPSIEQTVASAIDPISLAAECLEETSNYIEGDVREAIEHALAAGQAGKGTGPDSPRPQISSPISHSKQFSLASTRLSSACSTFRATQANLRYYGGARKTAYQLDLFVHKYALPTSTALHKRGQEVSAAMKWLKKMLNNDGRLLDALELSCLRRASVSLKAWAEGLRIHSLILRNASNAVKALMVERASLQAYSFPPKSPLKAAAPTPVSATGQSILSPLSKYTNISLISSPIVAQSQPNSLLSDSLPLWQDIPSNSIFPSSAEAVPQMPMMMSLPNNLPSTYVPKTPAVPLALPQSCAFSLVTSPGGTPMMQQTQQQNMQLQNNMFFDQQQQDQMMSYLGPAVSMPQQPFNFGMSTQDFGLPADFFDNLCV